jgi:hypothetical protein
LKYFPIQNIIYSQTTPKKYKLILKLNNYLNINMSSQIDFRTLPSNVPSLCIPRVFANIDERRIRRILDELDMGEIQRIDLVSKTTEKGEKFNRVFVHFKRWNSDGNAATARERLVNGKEIKIVYDEPWFWKVSAYRPKESTMEPKPRIQEPKKAHIQIDSDEEAQPSQIQHKNSKPQERRNNKRPNSRFPEPTRHQVHVQQQPRSPSNSPPRGTSINYGTNLQMPKKRNIKHQQEQKPKPTLKIEEDKECKEEEGEVTLENI